MLLTPNSCLTCKHNEVIESVKTTTNTANTAKIDIDKKTTPIEIEIEEKAMATTSEPETHEDLKHSEELQKKLHYLKALADSHKGQKGPPWVPQPQLETEDWVPWKWEERFKENSNTSVTRGKGVKVLFYGDSLIDGWGYTDEAKAIWDEHYGPLGAINYGIGGDRVEHMLWRIVNGEMDNLSPKLCVLRIGTNNVGLNTEKEIARGITAAVMELRVRAPSMKILLLGLLPRENSEKTKFVGRINEMISILDNGASVRYLDIGGKYYNLGVFRSELYDEDTVHLSVEGYRVWQEGMDELFNEMLKL